MKEGVIENKDDILLSAKMPVCVRLREKLIFHLDRLCVDRTERTGLTYSRSRLIEELIVDALEEKGWIE